MYCKGSRKNKSCFNLTLKFLTLKHILDILLIYIRNTYVIRNTFTMFFYSLIIHYEKKQLCLLLFSFYCFIYSKIHSFFSLSQVNSLLDTRLLTALRIAASSLPVFLFKSSIEGFFLNLLIL